MISSFGNDRRLGWLTAHRDAERGRARHVSALAWIIVSAACGGGTSEPLADVVATVEVTPNAVSRQVGETVQLGVALKNANGELVSGQAVAWSSSNQAVASVSNSGLVTAHALGSATVSATAGGKTGTSQVTVEGTPVASVTVLPETDTLFLGETVQLTAELKDASGAVIGDRQPSWSSSMTVVASVSANGLVTGVGDGTATITASSSGFNDTAVITVFGPCSIALTTPISVGDAVNASLATTDCQISDGSYLDGYSITVLQDTDVQVDMTSTAFDTWLELWELVDPTTLQARAVNDDVAEGNTNSRIDFTLEAGGEYFILANSFDPFVTGDYLLTVMAVTPAAGRVASPVLKRGKLPATSALRLVKRR